MKSVYVNLGCWEFPYLKINLLVSLFLGFLVFGFLVSTFLGFGVSWFLGVRFLGFLVSKFLGFVVVGFLVSKNCGSWFQRLLVSWFQSFEDLQNVRFISSGRY